MRHLRQIAACAVIALSIVPGMAGSAGAATYPRPMSNQWWFTAWQIQNKVWPITQGQGVTVGLIDSGVQANLPDFSGAVVPGTDETGGSGDGRTDTDTAAVAGHGTGMASLIVAQGRGTGFVGVSPKAKVLPIVANSTQSVSRGIHYAVDHGAKVINISQGAPNSECSSSSQEAVSYAIQHDVVVVVASGDYGNTNNSPLTPANCAGVLAVGAVNGQLKAWPGTERQPYVTVAGPGVGVGGVLKDGQFHTSPGGTSGAAALVSGAVALVRSKSPDMPAREVVQRIIASCRDAGPSGKDEQTGYGAVRPYNALVDHVPASAPNPVFAAYDKWAKANGKAVQTPGSQGTGAEKEKGGGFTLSAPVIFVGGIVLLMLIVVGAVWLSRRRGGKKPPPGQPPYGGAPQQPPYGQQNQGPPPSFGPQQNQGPPPGGTRPAFRPPPGQGPPTERR